jgi:hypothetical protein
MADDASYYAFLNKANEPTGTKSSTSSTQQSPSTSEIRNAYDPTVDKTAVPGPITEALKEKPKYISEADYPFDPVLFAYASTELPTTSEFSQLLKSVHIVHGEVESFGAAEFGKQYQFITDAVSQAATKGKGEVRVYRVGKETRTRVEYFILTVAHNGQMLVGVRVIAIES